MEALLISVGGALAASALIFGGRLVREWLLTRRGTLTGYWFWIVYEEQDRAMKGPMHSVEIVYLRHRKTKRVDKLTGNAWRLFAKEECVHRARRWEFDGHCADPVVWGSYVWTRDQDGSGGTTDVLRQDNNLTGMFTREARTICNQQVQYERKPLWTEWARVPKNFSPHLRQKLDLISAEDANLYPWRIRRLLSIPARGMKWVYGALASAMSPIDNRLVLAIQEWEQQHDHSDDGLPLERCDLDEWHSPES